MTSHTHIAHDRALGATLPIPIWTAAIFAGAMLVALSLYEYVALDWHPAREEPALYTVYHWMRMAITLALAAMLARAVGAQPELDDTPSLTDRERQMGTVSLAMAIGVIALLAANRPLFHAMAAEDLALEWASALLIFAGGALFLAAAANGWKTGRNRFDLLVMLGFGGLFLLIAMEEISWGQRVIGFATPEAMAEANWQNEFNFHNLQTDISELGYYAGAGILLIVLPLVRDAMPNWAPIRRFAAFIPDRMTALVSAPMLFLSYGHWNLLPIQWLAFFGIMTMVIFARSAWRRGKRDEATLFATMGAAVAIGQLAVLTFGPSMIEIFDATEYREFFIALGLACFAWQFHRAQKTAAADA
ncbi:hypothetical protein [Parasphingopyxis sp.]|uniref:hypothetical protein n=1 Tax=Parasphingopyxis sp. TaxID=1920299 RepID=UPI00261AC2A7|nr:hypothetical protein [Parasphingopyxis sp.]